MRKQLVLFCFSFGFVLLVSAQPGQMVVKGNGRDLHIDHIVSPKEGIFSIGRMYNVHPKAIATYNKLDMSKGLMVGQVIHIPLTDTNFSQHGNKGKPVYYNAGAKETLEKVSSANNKVSVQNLRDWNNLSSDNLAAGKSLIVGYLVTNETAATTTVVEKKDLPVKDTTGKQVTTKSTVAPGNPKDDAKKDDAKKNNAAKQKALKDSAANQARLKLNTDPENAVVKNDPKKEDPKKKDNLSKQKTGKDSTVSQAVLNTNAKTSKKNDSQKKDSKKTDAAVKKDSGKDSVAKQSVVKTETEPLQTIQKEEAPKEEPKRPDPVVTRSQLRIENGIQGYFKYSFDQQVRSNPPSRNETVTAGIFRMTNGIQDTKYYLLMDGVPSGTIVKVINPDNNKAIYAKVLGEMSGIRQNQGLNIRISNGAATNLDIAETDKFIVKINY